MYVNFKKEEWDFLAPKRGAFTNAEAFIDLRFLLLSCSKERTKKHLGEIVQLGKWEECLSLDFLKVRWRWNDTSRVLRFLKKLSDEGFLMVKKHSSKKFNILSVPIVGTTETQPLEQPLEQPLAQPFEEAERLINQMIAAKEKQSMQQETNGLDSCSNSSSNNVETGNSINIINTTNLNSSSTSSAHTREDDFQLLHRKKNEIAAAVGNQLYLNTLKKYYNQNKINFPPTTNHLVEALENYLEVMFSKQGRGFLNKSAAQLVSHYGTAWLPVEKTIQQSNQSNQKTSEVATLKVFSSDYYENAAVITKKTKLA